MARAGRRARRRRAPLALAALVVIALVALVAVTVLGGGDDAPSAAPAAPTPSASSDPTPSATTAPPPPRPRAGQCRQLGFAAAVATSDDTPAVRCTRPHTALTIAVDPLPADAAAVGPRCRRQAAAYLGGTVAERQLTMLHPVWFVPTPEQQDAGADWFRCDLIAVRTEGRLALLSGVAKGFLGSEAADRYAMCATAAPGEPGFTRVVCGTAHSWRAISTVPLLDAAGPRGRYPGVATVRARGQEPCKQAGADAASDPFAYRWGYEWPTAVQWADGQTYGICWVPA